MTNNNQQDVNVLSPEYGSILHIAVRKGALNLVKLLVDSGAELAAVHVKYDESLLYTALDIKDSMVLSKVVRYLVDDAKVPISEAGGLFGYPIIRAAHLISCDPVTFTKVLKFLIRREAQLDVADSQGRHAAHLACRSQSADAIRILVAAGADVNVRDKFGRMPVHFAASSSTKDCITYLLDNSFVGDINVRDCDGWTPLLWAARSGVTDTVMELISRGADVWVRGFTSSLTIEWSALKLAIFADQPTTLKSMLRPKERLKVSSDGEREVWDESFHRINLGHKMYGMKCDSCLMVSITRPSSILLLTQLLESSWYAVEVH